MARIIILNGVGSAGKSSIARALQDIAAEPFLHVAMDAFLDMLPAAYWDHPKGLRFEPVIVDGGPAMEINTGIVVEKALHGMRRAVAALADAGNNLIVDDVMLAAAMDDYTTLLASHDVSVVGIFAPLCVLEERERQRPDRIAGLARWQYERIHIHAGMKYDLEINTSVVTPAAAACKIKDAFRL